MTQSRSRSTLLASALALLLGGGAVLPALADAPLGMRDNLQVDYGATAPVNAALNAYLSDADRSVTAGAFDAIASGRFASPAVAALRDVAVGQGVPAAAYDAGQASGAFAAPAVGDAIRAAMRDQATSKGNFSVAAGQSLAPIYRGMLADSDSDAFGRLSFGGQAVNRESLTAAFAAQTSGQGDLREAMRADASESGLFANRGGSFSVKVSGDVLAGAFASEAEVSGAFSAPAADTGLHSAMRSEGPASGFGGAGEGDLSVAVDVDDLVAGLASDSLDQGAFAAEASLSPGVTDEVLSAMRAERSGGSFLSAASGLSRPQDVDFERIGAILAGADEE